MKKLFDIADQYIEESDWKVIAVLKFCLISLGVLLGMQVSPKYKKPVFISCLTLFAVTYIPLMAKLIGLFMAKDDRI